MSEFTVLDLLDLDMEEHNYLSLVCAAGRSGLSRAITRPKINRPGLALSGFFQDFSDSAIQLFGHGEQLYLEKLEAKGDYEVVEKYFTYQIPCIVFSNGGIPSDHIKEMAEKSAISILTTPLSSSDFTRRLYNLLDEVFANTETIHGVFTEVFGIGVLITGDSGIGKSEIALELIERGHRLISDDTVKLKNIADSHLIGSGENPMLAHHMEIRGIGIINLKNLFGVGSIREKKQVQLAVHLELWNPEKNYDRLGETEYASYLGIEIPKVVIPVKPGRNIPIIIETAARNERLKKLGYHSSTEFDQSVSEWIEAKTAKKMYYGTEEEESDN